MFRLSYRIQSLQRAFHPSVPLLPDRCLQHSVSQRIRSSSRRHLTSSIHEHGRSSNYPTEAERLEGFLKDRRLDTWGFPIYRCTYGDDKAWDECLRILKGRERRQLEWYEKPELYESLAWTILEEPEVLAHATKHDLRRHFKGWVGSAWGKEQPRAKKRLLMIDQDRYEDLLEAPRYEYFITIDRASMESVLNKPDIEDVIPERTGYVNLVHARWKSGADWFREELESLEAEEDLEEFFETDPCRRFGDMPDFSFEPIEGCREEQVGWMRLPAPEIGMHAYGTLGNSPHMWWYEYRRPPALSWSLY